MNKMMKEKQLKKLKSQERLDKITNGFLFMIQTFMLAMGLNIAIEFFIVGLDLELKTNWYLPLACWMLVIVLQTIYIAAKQHIENVKDIENKYNNLIDKIN